jgi:hypothetical protein
MINHSIGQVYWAIFPNYAVKKGDAGGFSRAF